MPVLIVPPAEDAKSLAEDAKLLVKDARLFARDVNPPARLTARDVNPPASTPVKLPVRLTDAVKPFVECSPLTNYLWPLILVAITLKLTMCNK